MKIGIIGTRGIPNHYGGFEQFAEFLSLGLVQRGHQVTVYNSHNHPYQEAEWKNVNIIHCKDPEHKMGTVGQFFYDRNCIRDSKKRNFDIILQLGYTSSSIWGRFLPKSSVITTNMDGLEWKRSKYSKKVQRFLLYAEKLGVKYSHHLIADSIGIQKYLEEKYNKEAIYIPYGATVFNKPDQGVLEEYGLKPYAYDMLIARLEPENNIEAILQGFSDSTSDRFFLVVGNHNTSFGEKLKKRFENDSKIIFHGGLYNLEHLNTLRHFSNLYFHGHSVGGTNPSLLEAMASSSLIVANDNVFNKSVLEDDAFYFSSHQEVTTHINTINRLEHQGKTDANVKKIQDIYSWERIIDQYEDHFKNICS